MARYPRRKFYSSPPKKDLLKSIWSQENGRLPNMAKLDRQKRSRLFRFLTGLTFFVALLAGITWLGLYFTSGRNQSEGIKINIESPTEVDNLKEIDVKIKYQNTDSQPLATASLYLRYPQELQIINAEPAADNENNNQWTMGTVEARQNGEIDLKVKILGDANTKINLQAIFTYKPANFNSEFQVINSTELTIKEPLIDLAFAEPGEALPGESLGLEITLRNNNTESFTNAALDLVLPPSFLVDKIEPAMTNNQRLTFKELAPDQEQKIKIRGVFASEAEGSYDIVANFVSLVGDKNYLLKSAKQTVQVTKSNLILRLFINEQAENQQAKLGDTLQIRMDLDNQSENEFEGVILKLLANSPLLDWKSLTGDNKAKVENNIATWDSSSFAKLAKIKANDKLSLNFKINLQSATNSQTDPTIKFSAKAAIGKINGKAVQTEIKTGEIAIRVGSDLGLQTWARYYDDNHKALGSGPWPPEMDKESHLVVFWRLTNNYHELQNLKVTTELPPNIRFDGKKDLTAGNLSFDPNKRIITWDISRLANTVNEVEAQFNISVLPQASDSGKILLLTGETQVVATDSVLGSQIAARSGALNSSLPNDKFAEGKGTVK
ncbi:MAG: hypothetical protein Q8M83_06635 [bacterium]|nr:hypothetical protein [bacterium]